MTRYLCNNWALAFSATLAFAVSALAADPDDRPSADPNDPLSITFVISDAKSQKGRVLCGLYDQEAKWLSRDYFQGAKSDVDEHGKARCIFRGIPAGSYAISAFHDLDSDNQLNRKIFGIPSEPYCASRNARRAFGPPRWRDAVFSYLGTAPIELEAEF
ncbi:MAG: DUF2141 domain-containing protein [Myxococcales bacterium]|nr:DUF2141 domain-containing protein [Myxococcales bacterium]